jgi:hypothetical protein
VIQVRFVELPVEDWAPRSIEAKRRAGIIGCAGASFVRAGREIDDAWQCFGSKRRENYDDWWRCEIRFEPELDELFGVTHSKQGVNPTHTLKSILSADLEAVARTLNRRVREAFERAKVEDLTKAERRAQVQEALLPPLPDKRSAGRSPGTVAGRIRGGQFRYKLEILDLGKADFLDVCIDESEIRVILNRNHPFYTRAYAPSLSDSTPAHLFHLECLPLSAARGIVALSDEGHSRLLRQVWSDALAAFLDSAR